MKQKSPLIVIFLTIFIDLVGFGIIIPLSPYLAKHYGANEIEVGLLQASYSLMQFLFAPLWGRLSDRYGRRPIILISLLGGGISYLLFAFSTQFWMLLVSRSLAGLFGGNISAASAYIADITPPESRSKNMGLIGAAFGLGFIFGPVFGGVLSHIGPTISEYPPFGIGFSALGAAALCVLNFTFAYFKLQESRKLGAPSHRPKVGRIELLFKYLKQTTINRLMISLFLSGLAMAHMESMLFLYVKEVFNWTLQQASFGFAYVGVMLVFTQGYLIRKLIPKYGERNLLLIGLLLGGVGISLSGIVENMWLMAITQTMLALGIGMLNPSAMGSISLLVGKDDQGGTMGVTQSLAALGRIIGPVSGGFLYHAVGRSVPFLTGGAFMIVALVLLLPIFKQLPQSGKSGTTASAH